MTLPLSSEEKPQKPVDPDTPPAGGVTYHVQDFDSWNSIASKYELDVWQLIFFNFRTRNSDEVNWYLREYVGCTQIAPDGNNWDFTSGITGGRGAWKGGVIYLPPEAFVFAPDIVLGQSDALLASRLPTTEDRVAGKELFKEIVREAHKRAQRFSELDASTVERIINEGLEIAGRLMDAKDVIEEITTLETMGGIAETVVVPAGMALGVIDVLREIGYSNQAKDIAQRRRTYYRALAVGIACGLDPTYKPPTFKNVVLDGVFQLGRNAMEKISVRKKRQLIVELIENNYFRSMHGQRPQTLPEYKALLGGRVFYDAMMNKFEHNEYLWR